MAEGLCNALVSMEKSLQSMKDLDIHPRSSQLLILNGRTAYHFLFVDCCFNNVAVSVWVVDSILQCASQLECRWSDVVIATLLSYTTFIMHSNINIKGMWYGEDN